MQLVATILPYAQIVLAILLGAGILLQQTSTNAGGAFGGSDNFSAGFHTRRGAELFFFRSTVVIAVLFVASAFLKLIIS